jgi:hypothetical protein
MHFDQCYVLAWLCRNIFRCKCIVMLPLTALVYVFYCVLTWAIYCRIKSRWCDWLPKTTVHCQLHQTQCVYSFKATSSAFGCNRHYGAEVILSATCSHSRWRVEEDFRVINLRFSSGLILCCEGTANWFVLWSEQDYISLNNGQDIRWNKYLKKKAVIVSLPTLLGTQKTNVSEQVLIKHSPQKYYSIILSLYFTKEILSLYKDTFISVVSLCLMPSWEVRAAQNAEVNWTIRLEVTKARTP